jgi:hypothetical protein
MPDRDTERPLALVTQPFTGEDQGSTLSSSTKRSRLLTGSNSPHCQSGYFMWMNTYRFTDAHGIVFVVELDSDDDARQHAKSTFPRLAEGVRIERQKWIHLDYYDAQREP